MWLAVLGVVFIGLGLAIGWYGLRPLVVVPRVLGATVEEPSAVAAGDEFVVCRGTVTADRNGDRTGTVAAPFSGTDCLGFEFEITERQPSFIGFPWADAYLDDGVATRRFRLDGDHGSLAVDPDGRRFSLDTDAETITVGAKETPPDRIKRFTEARDIEPVSRLNKS